MDEHGLEWSDAWRVTQQAVSYTNHTLMPEALECWSLPLFERMLPRHLEIVYEINARFLAEVRARFPGDEGRVARMSLIDENGERRVRMASLAVVASHKVNGVSALHSELMVQTLFSDFADLWPERFLNVTNGVTPRRWLQQANPALSALLDRQIGEGWRADLSGASGLKALARKAGGKKIGQEFLQAKQAAKDRLAAYIRREIGLAVDPTSLFDVQIKRIHEYKRQLLNVLHVIARWQAIVANPTAPWQPRTVIFAGKAASAYAAAKQVIQLIHDVARVVNSDPRVGDKLKVAFLPNYGVSLAQVIIPAADLSEQISTAGTEASGTGNMKFALNGACTIGTWDGANIEMAKAMGEEHMFVFGLRAEQVAQAKALGYDPRLHVEENLQLRAVLDALAATPTSSWRTSAATCARNWKWTRCSPTAPRGPSVRCATSPAWAPSAWTAPSASTSSRCGAPIDQRRGPVLPGGGHAPAPLRGAGGPPHDPGRRRAGGGRGALCRVGPQRFASERGGRLQRLGRAAACHALPRLVGRVGDLHPPRGAGRPLQVRDPRPRRAAAAAEV
jgi:starch phosphorylase